MLTDEQINILVEGIYGWTKGRAAATDNLPPYSAALGDVDAEKRLSRRIAPVAMVPMVKGERKGWIGGRPGLSRLGEQSISANVVIAGRPDLGMPGFRDDVPGKPMTSEDIADLVAWLASRRQGPAPGMTKTADANAGTPQPSTPNQ